MSPEADQLPRRAWVETVMGLPVSVHVRGPAPDSPWVADAVADVYTHLHRIDALLSPYRQDSELSRLQRGELAVSDASLELREALDLCAEAKVVTGGAFDARVPAGPWGPARIDPTGLVKGWAVERAAQAVLELSDHDAYVNAGGDLVVSTGRASEQPWRVGVEDPGDQSGLIAVVPIAGGAMATSGTAARGAHVYDPRTGRPALGVPSATVVGPSLLWADVHATACVVLGVDAALRHVAALPGYQALVVGTDGRVWRTPGLVTG
ncbi:MAG: FAD:protein FMN transferase [Motilibacteraceae bacterium]